MKRACGLLLAVILLAGCGDDNQSAADMQRMNDRFATLDYQMSDVELGPPPYVDHLELLTRRYLALIHEYEDELGLDKVKNRLTAKSAELEEFCLSCAGTLIREREKY